MPRFAAFLGGSNQTQSRVLDSERSVNLYVEQSQSQGAANTAALLPTPGFQQWAGGPAIPDVGTRGAVVANGRLLFVIGGGFYEIDSNGTATRRASVAQDSNPAQLVFNGVVGGHVLVASGSNGYCFVLATNAFTQVLTGEATMIAYAQGFFLAFNQATGKVRLSGLNDGTTWDPGTFFQRSLLADPWQAMFVDGNGLIWLPGTETFEVWYNTGLGTQPFAPLSGLVGRHGIAAPFAWALAGASVIWLDANTGGAGSIVTVRGASAQDVSSYAVDTAITGYRRTAKITDAEALVYQDSGHTFVNFAFPAAIATWSYDVEGQGWAERGRWNPKLGRYDLWAPRVHVDAFGKHLIGDRTTGIIAHMDSAYATELDGAGIVRLRQAPAIITEHDRQPYDRLELLMDSGLGLATGQGSDPQAMLRVSADAGRTFGNERIAGIGRMGEYRRRVYWTQLGVNSEAVFQVRFSDAVPPRIVDAFLNNDVAQRAA